MDDEYFYERPKWMWYVFIVALVVLAMVAQAVFAYSPAPVGVTMSSVRMTPCPYTFHWNLEVGSLYVSDIWQLQKLLNYDSDTQLASSGVGSPGQETHVFGSLTKAALIKFQNKYSRFILTPVGLTRGTGYFGPATRAYINSICSNE